LPTTPAAAGLGDGEAAATTAAGDAAGEAASDAAGEAAGEAAGLALGGLTDATGWIAGLGEGALVAPAAGALVGACD
jgi:hypothetical protein